MRTLMHEDFNGMRFSEIIFSVRFHLGMSTAEFAGLLGVGVSSVGFWEKRDKYPRKNTVYSVCIDLRRFGIFLNAEKLIDIIDHEKYGTFEQQNFIEEKEQNPVTFGEWFKVNRFLAGLSRNNFAKTGSDLNQLYLYEKDQVLPLPKKFVEIANTFEGSGAKVNTIAATRALYGAWKGFEQAKDQEVQTYDEMTFGKFLKFFRAKCDFTQADIDNQLGFPHPVSYYYERGKFLPEDNNTVSLVQVMTSDFALECGFELDILKFVRLLNYELSIRGEQEKEQAQDPNDANPHIEAF